MSAALRRLRRQARAARQRGIVALVALMFILVVAFFAMGQASLISASNMTDSARQADSVEALFLAESGIEYAGYKFLAAGGTLCDDTTLGVGSDMALGRGVFRVVGAFYSNFDGTAFATGTKQCRVRVQGEITASKATRTLETIVSTEEDVISISSLNPNFNLTPYDATRVADNSNPPTSWTLTGGTQGMQYIAWDHRGGNSDDNSTCMTTALDCDRAAFARKTDTGSGAATAGGAFNTTGVAIYITAPKTLRLTFDYRVWTRGSSNQEMQFAPRLEFSHGTFSPRSEPGGGDCWTNSTNGTCEAGATASGSPAWVGSLGQGCGYTDTACFESGPADATACPTYDPQANPVTTGYKTYGGVDTGLKGGRNSNCPTPPSGSTGYSTGYLTYDITGSGQVQLTSVSFTKADGSGALKGKEGQVTWLWIDNLRLSVPGIYGGGPSKLWREVAAP